MGKRKGEKRYTLVVEYKGGMDENKDRLIVKLVGRPEHGSGFCLLDGSRDLSFGFATRRGAEGAIGRIKTAKKRVVCYIFDMEEE